MRARDRGGERRFGVAVVTRTSSKSLWIGLFAILAAGSAHAQPSAAPEPGGDVAWSSIVDGEGATLGHMSRQIVQRSQGREIVESLALYFAEQGGEPTRVSSRTLFREDREGRTISISEVSQTGRSWTRTEANIDSAQARIVRETPSERRSIVVALPSGVRFDGGAALLRTWDPIAAPRLAFDNFSVDAMAVERIVIEAAPGSTPDAQGGITALRRRYEGAELRAVARIVLDADRRLVEVVQPMFGATVRIRPTDRETALRSHPPYRLLPNVMTRSPFRISPSAAQGHIRYRFAFRDGIEFSLPQTGEQRAIAEAGQATVDICSDCGPGLAADADALADARKPTVWLQSDHPRLRAMARPVAQMQVSDARKMELLLQRARPYLARIDFTGHYSALETLSRRAGDCTEAAVLLAALGRAAGIPTRVVNGLIYSRERYHGVSNAFMPHSWTLAWVDGQWKSFDLAFDAFDSTHIALTVGDGDARSVAAAGQLASLLRWESMAEIRTGRGR